MKELNDIESIINNISDKLVSSGSEEVRCTLAEAGYKHAVLANDSSEKVRACVARNTTNEDLLLDLLSKDKIELVKANSLIGLNKIKNDIFREKYIDAAFGGKANDK